MEAIVSATSLTRYLLSANVFKVFFYANDADNVFIFKEAVQHFCYYNQKAFWSYHPVECGIAIIISC